MFGTGALGCVSSTFFTLRASCSALGDSRPVLEGSMGDKHRLRLARSDLPTL